MKLSLFQSSIQQSHKLKPKFYSVHEDAGVGEGGFMAGLGLVCPPLRGYVCPVFIMLPAAIQELSDCETLIYRILEELQKICRFLWPK